MARAAETPEFESRPTVRLDQGMPEKDSIIELSDAAFRCLIETICYAGRTECDGLISAAWMRKNYRPKVIKELLEQGHLATIDTDAARYNLVDYLRWNRAAVEIDSFRASKGVAGAKGAHMRWHVPRRQLVADCPYCAGEVDSDD